MDKRRLGKMKEALPGEELLTKPITRRGLLAGAGATSLAVLLAACGVRGGGRAAGRACAGRAAAAEPPPAETGGTDTGAAPPTGAAPLKEGLAEGMYGGPVGWPGAERYQYPDDSEEGRAIAALRQLRQDGTAPDTLVVQVLNFARPQFEKALPRGRARRIVALFEEETGIKIEFVETEPGLRVPGEPAQRLDEERQLRPRHHRDRGDRRLRRGRPAAAARRVRRRSTSRAGSTRSTATPAASRRSTCSRSTRARPTRSRSTTTRSRTSTAPTCSRAPRSRRRSRTSTAGRSSSRSRGRSTTQVAEFFTRPDADVPLYGDVNTLAPFWCAVNWNERFVSAANPNMLYFNDDGSANVNNEAGIRAFDRAAASRSSATGPARSRRTGSPSTSSWAPATASWAARSRTRRSSSRATPTSTRPDVGEFIKTRRHAGPRGRRRARPPAGDLLQHQLRRERVRRPGPPRGRVPVPPVGRRRARLHVADVQPRRLPGSAPHLHADGSVRGRRATSRSRSGSSRTSSRARLRRSRSRAAAPTATRSARSSRRC